MRGEPFTLTGRGIGVVCEFVDDGRVGLGSAVTVAIPDSEGGSVEEGATVEAARIDPPEMELPALCFRVPQESERHALLLRLLRPGTTLAVSGAAGDGRRRG